MPERRKLTAEEKQKIRDDIVAEERVLRPGEFVRVHIEDETDDQGKPVVRSVRIMESEHNVRKSR